MPLLRAFTRSQIPNNVDDDAEREGSLRRASSLLRSSSAAPEAACRGVLLKQKANLGSWPQRYCWVEDGELRWAETLDDGGRGKKRGGFALTDITRVERAPTAERPHAFVVHAADRAIRFAAENGEDADRWVSGLQTATVPEDDAAELAPTRTWRFPARLVRSEEVVVTADASGGVTLSKYVGKGGFRLRLDGLADPEEIAVQPQTLRALALDEGGGAAPLVVVAGGSAAWSAAEHDAGSCLLAVSGEGRAVWKDLVESVVANEPRGADHAELAGWRLHGDAARLFAEGQPARRELDRLEAWLRGDAVDARIARPDDRVRFPTRYAPFPAVLADRRFVASVAVDGAKIGVPCTGDESVRDLLAEVLEKLQAREGRSKAAPPPPPDAEEEAPESVALRVAGRRAYLVALDAPLVAARDVVFALRDSTRPVATVGFVLERRLGASDRALLKKAAERAAAARPGLAAKEIAAALRERPPNVAKLDALPDGALEGYLPQLVQALKGGADPSLSAFLLTRALGNPYYVGATLFWNLRCEMTKGGGVMAAHGALLAAYLGSCGGVVRGDLLKQVALDRTLRDLTNVLSEMDDKHARTSFARQRLRALARAGELPAGMDLPCLPGRRAGRIRADGCRVLSSKAAPLLLLFDDGELSPAAAAEAPPILVIYKTRDDLRQDAAMLQSMRQMDRLWLDAGIECWLRLYTVAPTEVDAGWIEVVTGAKETAEIQATWGGGALGAFQNNTLNQYLVTYNSDGKAYGGAVERFAASCAACCVATYVLGIADRHNGNIMLSRDGRLFHIDFGHVLGHFKKIKGTGIKREKTKLVLTPEMMFVVNHAEVVDGEFRFREAASDSIAMHADFADRCAGLMAVLRDQGHALLLQTLKGLVPAGLPEITDDSIAWLPTVLMEDAATLRKELAAGLADWVRRLDNANHNRIHQNPTPAGPKRSVAEDRRSSTLIETQVEVEELRKLLSREEERANALQRELDVLRARG